MALGGGEPTGRRRPAAATIRCFFIGSNLFSLCVVLSGEVFLPWAWNQFRNPLWAPNANNKAHHKCENHWLSCLFICFHWKPDLCQQGRQNMKYWSGVKANRLLLGWFSCNVLWITERFYLYKHNTFSFSLPRLKQLPQQNWISEFFSMSQWDTTELIT